MAIIPSISVVIKHNCIFNMNKEEFLFIMAQHTLQYITNPNKINKFSLETNSAHAVYRN